MLKLMVDDSIQERENKLKKELNKQARPAIVASCSDGIVIATLNNLKRPKIKQVSGPIAFVGVGIWSDFNRLWEFACASLTRHRFVDASERDFAIFDKITEALCREIRQKFCNLYLADYYQCELVFAFLGEEKSKDRLHLIDCVGIEDYNSSFFIIPSGTGVIQPKLGILAESATMKEAFKVAVEVLKEEQQKLNSGTVLEVATLSRKVLLEGRLEDAYHKLTQEEIENWLTCD